MKILDATCGGRHLWLNKEHNDTIYIDRRILPKGTIQRRKNWNITPNIVADFTMLPFSNATFDLVVFDPPHIIRDKPSRGNMRITYGEFASHEWEKSLILGFDECWRVLKAPGTIHFKWSETDIPLKDVLKLFFVAPLFRNKHHVSWSVFTKAG